MLKKSEVLQEGYIKGLEKARDAIMNILNEDAGLISKIEATFTKEGENTPTEMEFRIDDEQIPWGVKKHIENEIGCKITDLSFKYAKVQDYD